MRLTSLLVLALLPAGGPLAHAEDTLTDPYPILERYFAASGGLERLRAATATHSAGTLSIGELRGTVEIWTKKPTCSRIETRLGVIHTIQGDNGDFSWILDSNDKLQKTTKPDELTRQRRDIDRRVADYEYADRNSPVFTVALHGSEKLGETECHVIKISNRLNSDHHYYSIGAADFRLYRDIAMKGAESGETLYDDYRLVDGLLVPFHTTEISYQSGQHAEIVVTAYDPNLDLPPGFFEPPEIKAKDYQFTAGTVFAEIPFRFVGGHIYVPVTVRGYTRPWILDSGANVTVVERSFADELGLSIEGTLAGVDGAGRVEAAFTVLPPFEIGPIRFEEQTVATIRMDDLVRRLGIDIAGVLGYDFLSRFVTRVDYSGERVSFFEPDSFRYGGEGTVIDIHPGRDNHFTAFATLDGTHAGAWLIDLGAATTSLDGCYALREGYTRKPGRLGVGGSAVNQYRLKTVLCDSVSFAGFTVLKPELSFAYGGTDTVFTADRLGSLGSSLFRHFVLYLDYGGERMILEKGGKFNYDWPRDGSGLSLTRTPDRQRVEVYHVSPDTPAERAGFRTGDILKSVGGRSVDELDGLLGVRELLKAAPGTEYQVVVERAGEESTLNLKLAELL